MYTIRSSEKSKLCSFTNFAVFLPCHHGWHVWWHTSNSFSPVSMGDMWGDTGLIQKKSQKYLDILKSKQCRSYEYTLFNHGHYKSATGNKSVWRSRVCSAYFVFFYNVPAVPNFLMSFFSSLPTKRFSVFFFSVFLYITLLLPFLHTFVFLPTHSLQYIIFRTNTYWC